MSSTASGLELEPVLANDATEAPAGSPSPPASRVARGRQAIASCVKQTQLGLATCLWRLQQAAKQGALQFALTLWYYVKALLSLGWHTFLQGRTVTFPVAALLLMWGAVRTLETLAHNGTMKRHRVPLISHDYTQAMQAVELRKQSIHHWCRDGTNEGCDQCLDPMEPMANFQIHDWMQGHEKNLELVQEESYKYYDVVFVGDEVTEEWMGRWKGFQSLDLIDIHYFFNSTFTIDGGGQFEGLALGNMGDFIHNVLWRLEHGEMPDTLQSKVWWITVGYHDLYQQACSEEVVLLGILYLAEYIKEKRPDSIVVINSVLHRNPPPGEPDLNMKSVQAVNAELKKFSETHTHIEYFDATHLFPGDGGKFHLHHKAHEKWGTAIKDRLEELLFTTEEEDVAYRNGWMYMFSPVWHQGGAIPPEFTHTLMENETDRLQSHLSKYGYKTGMSDPDVSPPLQWDNVPEGTKSFALICEDPDGLNYIWKVPPKLGRKAIRNMPYPPQEFAENRTTFSLWVLYNLPPTLRGIEAGMNATTLPPNALQGMNDYQFTGYGGPAPPAGRHRYFFKLYALKDVLPDLGVNATRGTLERAMKRHIIEETHLEGNFRKGMT